MEYLQYNGNGSEQAFGTGGGGGNKRKRNYSYMENVDGCNPVRQRSQANARERDRTHRCKTSLSSVNSAFSTLRTLIPTEPKDRKLSKIETLRLASSYISHLGTQLMAGPIDQPCLRVTKQFENENGGDAPQSNPSATNRYQVCTFCIAHKKTPKSQNIEEYICPSSLEGAGYFDQSLLENAAISLNPGPDIYF